MIKPLDTAAVLVVTLGGQSSQVLLQFLFLAAMMFVKTNALEWIMLQEMFPADDVFLLKLMF